MKILVCIVHYVPRSGPRHDVEGSSRDDIALRAATVSSCIAQWNSLLGSHHFLLGTDSSLRPEANNIVAVRSSPVSGDVYVCVNGDNHLLADMQGINVKYAQQSHGNPRYLPYFCRNVLLDKRNDYDLFVVVEDDTAALDPSFLLKIGAFYEEHGDRYLLLPNRYELFSGLHYKVYLECPSPQSYQLESSEPGPDRLTTRDGAELCRTASPYTGFFAVTRGQLNGWAELPGFRMPLEGQPMNAIEQAAIPMLARRPIYRPSERNMNYLEVHHLPNRACHARVPWTLLADLLSRPLGAEPVAPRRF